MSINEPKLTRRSFLGFTSGFALASGLSLPRRAYAASEESLATIIDLTLCNGCTDRDIPACISACRTKNLSRIPDPVDPIPKLFPRGKIEDWSTKKYVTNRLTPYNFIYVERATVEKDGQRRDIFIPRRCMHCDNPACATICPFTANHKFKNGAVVINANLCIGGAKCRTVCPWSIPQRQSGVGPYLYFVPTLAGNGAMFKCDLCYDLLLKGKTPVCMEACPQKALLIGKKEDIYEEAMRRAQAVGGFIYGAKENGGTATLYVSPVPFEEINRVIRKGPGLPHLGPTQRRMAETDRLGNYTLIGAPIFGTVAGLVGIFASRKGKGKVKNDD
jgi:formate dehydrogenase iron-sulfur subunit